MGGNGRPGRESSQPNMGCWTASKGKDPIRCRRFYVHIRACIPMNITTHAFLTLEETLDSRVELRQGSQHPPNFTRILPYYINTTAFQVSRSSLFITKRFQELLFGPSPPPNSSHCARRASHPTLISTSLDCVHATCVSAIFTQLHCLRGLRSIRFQDLQEHTTQIRERKPSPILNVGTVETGIGQKNAWKHPLQAAPRLIQMQHH